MENYNANTQHYAGLTLVSLLQSHVEVEHRGIWFLRSHSEEVFLSYAELYRRALQVLRNLQARDVQPGTEVILAVEDNLKFIVLFWACLLGKIVPVPLQAGNQEDHKQKFSGVWKTLKAPSLVCEGSYYHKLEPFLLQDNFHYLNTEDLLAGAEPGLPLPVQPDDLAYLQFSSGSTGTPKGVMLTHKNLITNIGDIITRSRTTIADKSLSWMPLSHDMGLICFHLCGLAAGIDQYIMNTSLFIRNPVLWIDKASQHRITQLYAPNFGYHYFLSAYASNPEKQWDLSAVRIIYNGAEPISYELCDRFRETLSIHSLSPVAMFPGYGLAEASVAVALPDVHDVLKVHFLQRAYCNIGDHIQPVAPDDGIAFVETGYPLDNCAIRITGPDGEIYDDNRIGHIQIKGGNVTAGYYNNEAATYELITTDGWLRTGDVGFLCNRRLTITGRSRNIIIVNGQNYYPQDIEQMIQRSLPDFDLGKVVVCGVKETPAESEQLLVFLLYKGDLARFLPYVKAVRDAVLEKAGLPVRQVIPVRKIPKTTSGKIQHFKLVSDYQQHAFDEICEQLDGWIRTTEDKILPGNLSVPEKLAMIWTGILGMEPVPLDMELFAAGLNSLTAMRFINYINRLLSVQVSVSDLLQYPSLAQLAACLESRDTVISGRMAPVEEQEHYPCTSIQKRFWLLQQLQVNTTAYNLQNGIIIKGRLDLEVFRKAVNALISQYDVLRTTFFEHGGEVRQRVSNNDVAAYAPKYIDLRSQLVDDELIAKIALEEIQLPFDLEQGPLMRCTFYHLEADKYLFFFAVHHIVADGWSVIVMMNKLKSFYREYRYGGNTAGQKPGIQFSDFAAYKQASRELAVHQQYWQKILAPAITNVEFPFSRPRSAVQTLAGDIIRNRLPESLMQAVKNCCDKRDVTPFMMMAAVLRVLLFRYTQQTDIIIGTDTAGRIDIELEEQLGCFLNTLPLRLELNAMDSFDVLLGKEKERILEALEHQSYPFDRMVADAKLTQDFSGTPLFNVLLLFRNLPGSYNLEGMDDSLLVESLELPVLTSMVDLELEFFYEKEILFFDLKFNTGLFDRAPMKRLVKHFMNLLQQAVLAPETPIGKMALLDDAEEEQLYGLGRSETAAACFIPLTHIFAQQVTDRPDATALIFEDITLSFEALNEQSNILAGFLVTEKGIQPGNRLGIMMGRSHRMIIAVLAILKTGATYVPIDPEYPAERIGFILSEASLQLVLTDLPVQQLHLPEETVVTVPEEIAELGYPAVDPGVPVNEEDIAYILYTSGSTGHPKGVMITHESLSDYIQTFTRYFAVTSADRIIQQSSLVFDISVEEIFSALCSGATLIILKEGGRNIEALLEAIETEAATILSTTPAVVKEINQQAQRTGSLRVLISGGDTLKPAYIDQLIGQVAIYNTYGPTEATVCVTYQRVSAPEEAGLIGFTLPGHRIYILDESMNPVPVGVAGQLYIAGKGLAKGYVKKELDNGAFMQHPVSGERLYRTGDMALWTESGAIRFLGRKDTQLKWNGYRIEAGEVERQILLFGEIDDAVVRMTGSTERQLLTGYIVTDKLVEIEELRAFLSEKIPAYMIPAAFVVLDNLPLNANGKIDINALPEPNENTATAFIPAGNIMEASLEGIWRAVLKQEKISVLANFFALGGNSLEATRIVSRIRQTMKADISLRDLFQYPTVRGLARKIAHAGTAAYEDIRQVPLAADYPLSLGQRKLWVLHRLEALPVGYNLCWSFMVKGAGVDACLEKAVTDLMYRHESLLTVFREVNGEPRMLIDTNLQAPIYRVDVPLPVDELSWRAIAEKEGRTVFDLENGPLFRVKLLQLQHGVFRIIFTIHHIITDGWSMELIWQELNTSLQMHLDKTARIPASRGITYKDYVDWQYRTLHTESMMIHAHYWRERFKNSLPVFEFPSLKTADALSSSTRGRKMQFPVSDDCMARLSSLAVERNVTLFTVLVAVWKLLLHKLTGQQQMIIATPVAGRNHPMLEDQVGYYLNILPLLTTFTATHSFAELLKNVQQTIVEAFEHQDYPVEKLMEHLEMGKHIDRNPLFDVMLVLQNFGHIRNANMKTGNMALLQDIEEIDNGTTINSLLIEFSEFEQHYTLKLRYNTDIFSEAQINRIGNCFEHICTQVLADHERPLSAFSLVTDEDRHQLQVFSATASIDYPYHTIWPLLERAAEKYPRRIALQCGSVSLSYGKLQEKVDCVAWQMSLMNAAGPGKRVGILLGRSTELVISMLAVLKSGAAYIPLDPEYPEERIMAVIVHAGVDLVITNADCLHLHRLGTVPVMDISGILTAAQNIPPLSFFAYPVQPDEVAYIMYTSGSTGVPKGVKISQGALSDYVQTFIDYFGVNEHDSIIQQASPAFDVSIEEIFPALCCGARVLISPEGGRDIEKLLHLINYSSATILSTTPAVVAALNECAEEIGTLRILISGGDRLSGKSIDRLLDKVLIYNTYGPTETTVCATYHTVRGTGDAGCIGKPIANREVYVLNEQLQLVPPGVPGEIYIAGAGLSMGYLDMEQETRERFVRHPFKQEASIYRTGDLGMWSEEGYLYFAGRKDSQVKVNGYRVEKAEVEKALLKHEEIKEALVLTESTNEGALVLRAYLVTRGNLEQTAIRTWISRILPYYMIPATFVMLEAFPLTINGKIDEAALQKIVAGGVEHIVDSMWEQRLAQIWLEVLGKDVTDSSANFFALGGNSIKATRLVSRLEQHWQVRLPLREVFIYPTLGGMAGIISEINTAPLAIVPLDTRPYYEVSNAQKRIWILSQLGYEQDAYNIYTGIRLSGKIQPLLVDQCFKELIARHESLRTTFHMVEGKLMQHISSANQFTADIIYTNLIGTLPQDTAIDKFIREAQETKFDLVNGPLFSIRLLQLEEESHILLFVAHHIITDGWSVSLLFHEWQRLYEAACRDELVVLPALTFQYKDYAHYMNSASVAEQLSVHRKYWQKQFEDHIPLLELPTDFPRPGVSKHYGSSCTLVLPASLGAGLHALAGRYDATVFMVLLAALNTLLYRYCGQNDIVIGTPVSGREMGGLENQVGCYVNTLPLRTTFSGKHTFEQLLQEVKKVVLEAFGHQAYPFDTLVELLYKERDLSRSPFFDVMLAMQTDALPPQPVKEGSGLQAEPFLIPATSSKFDLTLYVYENGHDLQLVLEYSTELFTQATVSRFLDHYRNVLEQVTALQNIPVCSLKVLGEEEERNLLEQFRPAQEQPRLVTELIAEVATKQPGHPAVICGTTVLSYSTLLSEATRVAYYLKEVGDIQPGDTVGLLMGRSEKMVVNLLGILMAGAAYVPVDTAYPLNRIHYMLHDSAARIVLTEEKYKPYLNDAVTGITEQQLKSAVLPQHRPIPLASVDVNATAYIIYTSGTTGYPKGIPVSYSNLWSLIHWARMEFEQDQFDLVYAPTSYCFDLSVFELLYPLSIGKSVRVLESGLQIAEYLGTDNNILINTVPGVMEQLVKNAVDLSQVKSINLAGEPLPAPLVPGLVNSGIRLRNLYGPSEDTTYSTCYQFRPGDTRVTIGRPLSGKHIYILDTDLNLLPAGAKGEIGIGGPGVVSGYLNMPELTNEKFVPDPYSPGEILYLTGDMGRWLPDGNLEFLGRKDHQLKIRGYRIEPAEIEQVFLQIPGIRQVLVTTAVNGNNEKYLLAFYVANGDVDRQEIRQLLEQRLPAYMIPQQIIRRETFPLTVNGKIDRTALLQTHDNYTEADYLPPVTAVEKVLTEIWKEVLNRELISIKDNWFTIGGHSLNATQVIYKANRHFQIRLELRDMFFHPTIAQLAIVIEGSAPAFTENIPLLEEQDHYAPSYMQRRLWILDRIEKNSAAYNMSSTYRLEGSLDIGALEQAYLTVLSRHESLRATFIMVGGIVRQKIRQLPPDEQVVTYVDMRESEDAALLALQLARACMNKPFDLEKDRLLRVTVLHYAENSYMLVVSMHHIISDGWSMNVIQEEILNSYLSAQENKELGRAALKMQYHDFAAWYNRQLDTSAGKEMGNYWRKQLAGEIALLDMPGSLPRPAVKTYAGSEAEMLIGREESEVLRLLANRTDATLFMVLLAALKTLFYRYTAQEDILVGIPANGRWVQELEDQVGFYVNTLVLRTRLKGTDSFITTLEGIKDNVLAALEHQYYPFDKLLEELRVERKLDRSPLFDVMVVYQDGLIAKEARELQGLRWEEVPIPAEYSKFDLTITFIPAEEGITIKAVYNTDIYNNRWISQMLGHYRHLLKAIAADPAMSLSSLSYLTPEEQQQLLAFNAGVVRDIPPQTLVALFERQAARTPAAKAVIFGDVVLSYQELNGQANRLAAVLRNTYHLKPGDLVGLMLDRSEKQLIGILGILKSGAAYVPIDPAYPLSRRRYIIENSALKALLVTPAHMQDSEGCECIVLDEVLTATEEITNPPHVNTPGDLAYVIYTSGTTGRPKGVMVEHHSVVNLSAWLAEIIYHRHTAPLTVMVNAPVSFDSAVKQLFPPLLAGACLVLVSEETHTDPKALVAALYRQQVDVWDITPSYLAHILKYVDDDKHFPAYTLAGGEPLSPALVERYNRLLQHRSTLINVYGVTEATVDSTYCITNEAPYMYCTIGKPIHNTAIYLLDHNRQLVPPGFPGEICIAGKGVSRGYLKDEQQTAAKFVTGLYGEGALYCTGDIGRWHTDGTLEFIGRADRQVKISGYRVELGEVEQALLQYPGMQEALAIAVPYDQSDMQIVAYFVSNTPPELSALRVFLQAKLPVYMLPAWLVPVQEMPLNEHGKINREALPDYRVAALRSHSQPVRVGDEIAQSLVTIWEKVLECGNVGLHDNFFELGGNSLKLIRLFDHIQDLYPDRLEVHQLFSNPTISQLAALLQPIITENGNTPPKAINLIEF
jgi:amino acid adenylation domain-containing protein